MIYQADNAGIDQRFGAVDAREVRHIAGAPFCGYAVQGSLDDGICFRVDGTDAVPIDQQMTNFIAVRLTGWGAVEAAGQDAFIPHENAPNKGTVAGAPFGNRIGNFHEV